MTLRTTALTRCQSPDLIVPVSPECLGICLPRTTVALWYRTDFRHRPVHLDFVILGYVMLLVLRTITGGD
jgi:hypothetical protein